MQRSPGMLMRRQMNALFTEQKTRHWSAIESDGWRKARRMAFRTYRATGIGRFFLSSMNLTFRRGAVSAANLAMRRSMCSSSPPK